MKIFFSLFFLSAIVLAIYPFLDSSEANKTITGLPWQIEIKADGSTQIFGLHIGESRLSDAVNIIGDDMALAIIAAAEETGNLEMYYGHYRAGLLAGKLILQTGSSEQRIRYWRKNAVSFEYMASGNAKKYILSKDDELDILSEIVTGLTFVPAVNIDEEVILARFGTPDEKLEFEGVTHYLYATSGLHIAHYENAKEVIQYVAPDKFIKLSQPLKDRLQY